MTVYDLNDAQLLRLKERLQDGDHEIGNLTFAEYEIVKSAATAQDIPDEIVYSAFSGYTFAQDDF